MSSTNVKSRVCSPSPKIVISAVVERRRAEPGEGHVRALARTVDREVAQRGDVDAEVVAEREAEVLGGELRHAVGRERARRRGLVRRQRLRLPVDRRGRGVHEPVAGVPVRAGLEQVLGREQVVAQVRLEARAPARPHAGLGGEVKDRVDVGDEVGELAARQVDRHEVEGIPLARALEVADLRRTAVVVVEAVDADDVDAVTQERLGQRRADESGTAGDKGPADLTFRCSSVHVSAFPGSRHSVLSERRSLAAPAWSGCRPASLARTSNV